MSNLQIGMPTHYEITVNMEQTIPPSTVRRTRSGNSYTVLLGGPDTIGGADIIAPQQQQALPGRPRRKRDVNGTRSNNSKVSRKRQRNGSFTNYVKQLLITIPNLKIDYSLLLAILLWYCLGVLSIASSKILLSGGEQVGIRVNPLSLTLQQLVIGVSLFRFFLRIGFMNTPGLVSWPPTLSATLGDSNGKMNDQRQGTTTGQNDLNMAAICFAFGFLATNFAFSGSAASFVETVKAAEPITSAAVAVAYGIETITLEQQASLGTIIVGVLLSTLGSSTSSNNSKQTILETLKACAIVMAGNVCFSFRGLYQKLFRKHVSAQNLDDLNLQFRMQWFGVLILAIPTLLFDIFPYLLQELLLSSQKTPASERHLNEVLTSRVIVRYVLFSLFNGMAFSCYNLASTWILSRISVVHHAALNCIRRVFAVIVTSIFFGIPITLMGALGIALAVVGFLTYTHYKIMHQQQLSKQHSNSILP